VEGYPLYAWTKKTVDDTGEGSEIHQVFQPLWSVATRSTNQGKADALEAELTSRWS